MTYVRKTVDAWEFHVDYGQGWEHEITEFSRAAMLINRAAYRENCSYPVKIVPKRIKLSTLSDHERSEIATHRPSDRIPRLADARAMITCPACGESKDTGLVVCSQCGNSLKASRLEFGEWYLTVVLGR